MEARAAIVQPDKTAGAVETVSPLFHRKPPSLRCGDISSRGNGMRRTCVFSPCGRLTSSQSLLSSHSETVAWVDKRTALTSIPGAGLPQGLRQAFAGSLPGRQPREFLQLFRKNCIAVFDKSLPSVIRLIGKQRRVYLLFHVQYSIF